MILILPTFYRYNITFTFINREVMLHKFNTVSIQFFNNMLKNMMRYFTD